MKINTLALICGRQFAGVLMKHRRSKVTVGIDH